MEQLGGKKKKKKKKKEKEKEKEKKMMMGKQVGKGRRCVENIVFKI